MKLVVEETVTCQCCSTAVVLRMTLTEWVRWVWDNTLPREVPDEHREILISGTCDDCWTEIMALASA